MKVAIVILLSLSLFSQVYGSVYITDVKIKGNDMLTIEANILNNSNDTIAYTSLCDSPLEAEFDDNIAVEYGIACLGFSIESLEPFENVTVRGPASGVFYKVVDQGLTNANITFNYLVGEEQRKVSKEVVFMIDDSRKVEDRFDISINQTVSFNDLEMTLFAINDSRCPRDVVCIWEGDAKLSLAIKKDDLIDNFIAVVGKPFLIDNIAMDISLDIGSNKPTFVIKEPEGSIKFKAYNDRYGLLGILDLDNDEGSIILFNDNRRELLQFTMLAECSRLAMICFDADDKHIEIGDDFMLIDKQYIPTIDIRSI